MEKKLKRIKFKKLKKYQRVFIGIGILFLVGILYEGCQELKNIFSPNVPSDSDKLKKDEREKIIFDSNGDVRRIRRTRDGHNQTERISRGAEEGEVIIKDDGTVEYREKIFGFLMEPGLSMSLDRDELFVGPDLRFAYWRNFGLVGGLSTNIGEQPLRKYRGHLGLSYRLPFKRFRNTSVVVGYNTNQNIQAGIRIKF